ncbi:unannotated protein [freshwater metagenome]|uniref:Unannotated protein n=1 Tax=freshwater metagenome TaxID=449393 RepID=A0A6J7JZK5_9ZZZZ
MPQSNVDREIDKSVTPPSRKEITSFRAEVGSQVSGLFL